MVFAAYVTSEFTRVCRIDIVWDQYEKNSLKSRKRERRYAGGTLRRKVEMSTLVPSEWHEFLRVDGNKTELFRLLRNAVVASVKSGKELVLTVGTGVSAFLSDIQQG